jgi:putative transposase
MILTEQHIIKRHSKDFRSIDTICFLSKNLYNYSLYQIRKHFEETGKFLTYNDLEKELRTSKQIDYISLPNNTSQQILMLLDRNMKSYFNTLKSWKKDKKKFKGCPEVPKFKHKTKGRNIVVFTSNQFRLKENKIFFPKKSGLKSIRTKILNHKIQQVRIIPKLDYYVYEVVYKIDDLIKENYNDNWLSIDLGLNNLATCITSKIDKPFIINGKPLKSTNQYYNKKYASLKSNLEKNHKRKSSKKLRKLTLKRNNKIKDYLHKSSKFIIDYCIENKIDNILLGKNKGWKQEINIGKKNNQNFVQIPFNLFESYLSYKSEKFGLKFKTREESYTSKCSAIDLEQIKKHEKYLGRRKTRGNFHSKNNIRINADVNGSYNILRKEIGDDFIKNKISSNRGLVVSPIKINFNYK